MICGLRRAGTFLCMASAAVSFATAASAQNQAPLPPDAMTLNQHGVDLRAGVYRVNRTVLAIGDPESGGIDFRRISRSYGRGEYPGKMAQFNHNWDISFRRRTRTGSVGYDISATSNGVSYNFHTTGGTGSAMLTSNTGYAEMTLVPSGSDFYYSMRTSDGITVVSQPTSGTSGSALAASVSYANGITYTLSYDALGPSGASRLRRVVSNAGYALLLEYHPNSGTNFFVSKACVLNLAQVTPPATNVCPAGAPTASYAYSGETLASETDPDGTTIWPFSSTYTSSASAFQERYFLPGSATPYLTVDYERAEGYQMAIRRQTFADGRTIEYSWTAITDQAGDTTIAILPIGYSESNGSSNRHTNLAFGFYRPNVFAPMRISPGPTSVDASGRVTTFDYCLQTCAYAILRQRTSPSGVKSDYLYDLYRNVTKVTDTPAPGSSLAPRITTATYDCSSLAFCKKPTSIVDPNGNQTDYSYSPVHGQVLTETRSAVNGVRPQTRYSYAQRYAWIANGSGGYVQASAPIWLLVQESVCRMGSPASSDVGCANGATDEVVTQYDYGPDAGPNNLLLRGQVVTADGQSLRTCYGYDAAGNRVSETRPNANLAACP